MFMAVPPRYDLINHVITLGMDARWRRLAAETCAAGEPRTMLDLCCGTGGLLLGVARRCRGDVMPVGLDFSEPMLKIAERKASGTKKGSSFVYGDASQLPFPDESFDCVGISFAFRNLMYKNPLAGKAMSEVARVLKNGGRFVAVESSQPRSGFIRAVFRLYLRCWVYPVGWLLSGNRSAYKYLATSASRFHTPGEIKDLLLKVGFSEVSYRPLFFGAAGIHVAMKKT
jgi:demethylmenaquinone methyltransferase/2-methoxy-6-polyprenyl-1,4-benzoquinol methylase